MEKLSGIIARKNGSPWDSKLIKNDVLGWVTPEQEQEAIAKGWIKKLDGVWKITRESIICTNKDHSKNKGYGHNHGEYVSVVNQDFMAHKQKEKDKMWAKINEVDRINSQEQYQQEANESLGKEIPF